jgi:hypothetical protein
MNRSNFTRLRRNRWAALFIGVLIIMLIIPGGFNGAQKSFSHEQIDELEGQLHLAINYLADLPEVRSISVENTDISIIFDHKPDNWNQIIRIAALRGSQATGEYIHVWAFLRKSEKLFQIEHDFIGETTAYRGLIVD